MVNFRGAVNAAGGRTYPMEVRDHLFVMIEEYTDTTKGNCCHASTVRSLYRPGRGSGLRVGSFCDSTETKLNYPKRGSAFGQALDNCVSIEPEGAGEWVIERMPSKRVMTIMAPLVRDQYWCLAV